VAPAAVLKQLKLPLFAKRKHCLKPEKRCAVVRRVHELLGSRVSHRQKFPPGAVVLSEPGFYSNFRGKKR